MMVYWDFSTKIENHIYLCKVCSRDTIIFLKGWGLHKRDLSANI